MLVRQVLDNTMITAGLITDTKTYVNRVNKIIEHVLANTTADTQASVEGESDSAQREQLDSIIDSINQEDMEKIKQELNKQEDIIIDKDGNPSIKN